MRRAIYGVIAQPTRTIALPIPGVPTIGTATDSGTGRAFNNGRANVTFTPADANATSFTVTSSPGGFTGTGASSPINVTGLQSNTSYTFTVTASNISGSSASSASSNSITATTVPQAPTIGTATGGNTNATVAYTAGATGGSAVSVYTATSTPSSITGTGASPITVSGLTNNTAYTFKVSATNANGTSLESAASNSVTPAAPAFAYSWTVPYTNVEYNDYWYIDTSPEPYNTTITLSMNPRSSGVPGWPPVNLVKTFTISGITGVNAALNGTTITATAYANKIENVGSFGAEFTSTYIALGIPQFVSLPKNTFPGFTLNWN